MTVLILGARGFIGTNIVNHLLNKGYFIVGCDLVGYSTRDYEYHKLSVQSLDFELLFRRTVDFCINASGSGNVGYSITHPLDDFEANTLATAKVLDVIRKIQELRD